MKTGSKEKGFGLVGGLILLVCGCAAVGLLLYLGVKCIDAGRTAANARNQQFSNEMYQASITLTNYQWWVIEEAVPATNEQQLVDIGWVASVRSRVVECSTNYIDWEHVKGPAYMDPWTANAMCWMLFRGSTNKAQRQGIQCLYYRTKEVQP